MPAAAWRRIPAETVDFVREIAIPPSGEHPGAQQSWAYLSLSPGCVAGQYYNTPGARLRAAQTASFAWTPSSRSVQAQSGQTALSRHPADGSLWTPRARLVSARRLRAVCTQRPDAVWTLGLRAASAWCLRAAPRRRLDAGLVQTLRAQRRLDSTWTTLVHAPSHSVCADCAGDSFVRDVSELHYATSSAAETH